MMFLADKATQLMLEPEFQNIPVTEVLRFNKYPFGRWLNIADPHPSLGKLKKISLKCRRIDT